MDMVSTKPFQSDNIASSNSTETRGWRLFQRKYGVFFISLTETIGSLVTISIYIYAFAKQPSWLPALIPFYKDLSGQMAVVHGVMYIILFNCILEFVLALYLFDGARREKLGKVHFWLSSMITFQLLGTIVIFGMDLGGIHCPRMDFVASINIFLRFLQFVVVNTWLEEKKLQRKLKIEKMISHARPQENNNQDISSLASINSDEEMGKIPPPSYDCTFPSCTWDHVPPRGLSSITEEHQH